MFQYKEIITSEGSVLKAKVIVKTINALLVRIEDKYLLISRKFIKNQSDFWKAKSEQ